MKRLLLVCFMVFLCGCIKSEIQSFTDPDYQEVKFKRLVVDLTALSDSTRIVASKVVMQRLQEAGYEIVDINQVLPPTRKFTPEEAVKLLSESGYDNIMRIVVTGNQANSYVSGIYTYSNASVHAYGNHAYGNASSYSTPIVSAHSETSIQTFIYDSKNLKTAWQATINTTADGTMFAGDTQSIAHSVIGKIIDQLKIDNHS